MKLWLVALVTLICKAESKDHGVFGETFPIQEKSLLEVIKTKLQGLSESGKLEEHQQHILNQTKERANRPIPAIGIVKTTKARTFTYDPTITVPYDLIDHKGQVFHKKGTKVNPLETQSLRCSLLFIDGDDPSQVSWARGFYEIVGETHKPKIILVKGAPLELTESHKIPVYFDQAGSLVKKLGITQVPAHVSQKDKVLQIEEIVLGEQE